MKSRKYLINTLILSVVMVFSACNNIITDSDWDSNKGTIQGSGRLVAVEKDFSNFDKINLSHSFNAKVFQSDEYSVTLKMDDNIIEYLESSKSGDELLLGLSNGYNYNDITLEVEIRVPDVTKIELSGASAVELYGFGFSHSLNIYLSGASSVKGNINVGDIQMDMSGASFVNLTGEGKKLAVYGSGASTIELPNFPVDEASIVLSGASYSKINVHNYLTIHLTGASVLYYTGNPTIGEISADGVSKIVKY